MPFQGNPEVVAFLWSLEIGIQVSLYDVQIKFAQDADNLNQLDWQYGLTRTRGTEGKIGLGPIAQACDSRQFDRVVLLSDYADSKIGAYRKWIRKRVKCPVDVRFKELSGPTNFGDIYEAAREVAGEVIHNNPAAELVFHLSPGTPAMAAVWIILAKTRYPAELIESSQRFGVKTASVPFDLATDFYPRPIEKLRPKT